MKSIFDRLIHSYGSDVMITSGNGGATSAKMFFHLVTSKSWQNMERMIPTGGEIPRGQFLFIASADTPVVRADCILLDSRIFTVRRADPILFRSEHLFIWGLCVEGGDPDPWNT